MSKIKVIIPTYGEHHLTRDLLCDIYEEINLVDVLIIDNKKDFSLDFDSRIITYTPEQNLGWLKSINFGLSMLYCSYGDKDSLYVCLNNDVRLSPKFFQNLLDFYSNSPKDLGVFSPCYRGSHVVLYPLDGYQGDADKYKSVDSYKKVPFIDGTCFCIPQKIFEEFGGLDLRFHPSHGWGGDLEYCVRVKEKGYNSYVTYKSYLYHLISQTAIKLIPQYYEIASREQDKIFKSLWGDDYNKKILFMN